MKPTEILSSEHRVIEQVLNCLEAMAERGVGGPLEEGTRKVPSPSSATSPTAAITARKRPTCFRPWRPRAFHATAGRPA